MSVKTGDRVRMTTSPNAPTGNTYFVEEINDKGQLWVTRLGGWWWPKHFEYVSEQL